MTVLSQFAALFTIFRKILNFGAPKGSEPEILGKSGLALSSSIPKVFQIPKSRSILRVTPRTVPLSAYLVLSVPAAPREGGGGSDMRVACKRASLRSIPNNNKFCFVISEPPSSESDTSDYSPEEALNSTSFGGNLDRGGVSARTAFRTGVSLLTRSGGDAQLLHHSETAREGALCESQRDTGLF